VIAVLYRFYRVLRHPFRGLLSRLTPAGLIVAIGIVMAAGSYQPRHTMGMPVVLLLLALLLVGLAMAPWFRVPFSISRRLPRLVEAGSSFPLRITLTNRSRTLQRGLEYREELLDTALTRREFAARLRNRPSAARRSGPPSAPDVPVPDCPPGGSIEIIVAVTARRRGVLRLEGGRLIRTDPFGLVRAFCRYPAPQTILVLPRRHAVPALSLDGRSHHQQGGVSLASGVGEAEEFVALREYRRGDPLRRVHWRSTARVGRLVIRECHDEHFVRHALALDTCCTPGQDDLFEEAVAVAASFACTVPTRESLLDLLFIGHQDDVHQLTCGRGVGQVEQMLEALAVVQPCRGPRFATLAAAVERQAHDLSGCILVLLAWDEPRRALVRRLKARSVPCQVLLLVPAGTAEAGIDRGPAADQPDRLVILAADAVAEGLQQLAGARR
jgi:uncharacterized protein (DUF58 family)